MAESPRRHAPLPLAQAFVVCREILEDRRTGDFALIGPFYQPRLWGLNGGSMAPYVSLSGGEPERMRRLGLPVLDTPEGPFLGTREAEDGRHYCAALAGRVGRGCACSVYPG